MTVELVLYHTWLPARSGGYESALRSAFVKRGRKWLHVVALDAGPESGIRVRKVPLKELQYMKPLLKRNKKPYPVSRALKSFRRIGKTHGITKGAKRILKEAANG